MSFKHGIVNITILDYSWSSFSVKFRFVVFRPFIDEVLTARIRSCNHEGVQGDELSLLLYTVCERWLQL